VLLYTELRSTGWAANGKFAPGCAHLITFLVGKEQETTSTLVMLVGAVSLLFNSSAR
jgi:hypothetical protein